MIGSSDRLSVNDDIFNYLVLSVGVDGEQTRNYKIKSHVNIFTVRKLVLFFIKRDFTRLHLYFFIKKTWLKVNQPMTKFAKRGLSKRIWRFESAGCFSLADLAESCNHAGAVLWKSFITFQPFPMTAKRGLPPGPSGLPLLGATLKWKGPETNFAWTQEYGPIYSVRMGPNTLVYLNTIELVEEFLEQKGDAYLGRPAGPAAIANGLLFGEGQRWKENRGVFECAMWRSSLNEAHVHREADIILRQLSEKIGSPVHLADYILPTLTSCVATILLGEPLDRDSPDMQQLLKQMEHLQEVNLTSMSMQIYLKARCFRRPLEVISGQTIPDLYKISEVMQRVMRGWVVKRREALHKEGEEPNPKAILDQILMSEIYKSRAEDDDAEMIQSVMDLFFGGVLSSLSVVEFLCLYLMHNPEVQTKVKAELDKAVEKGVEITWANREQLPYTLATLTEVLRLGSVTPSSLPHVATENTTIADDYEIPKGTFVLAGIYSLHRDPRFYQNPEVFDPTRHLDKDGRFVMPKSFRPYGVGKRLCLGYHLSDIELFLLMTRLLSRFRLRAENPEDAPPFDSHMRIVRRLKPFMCVTEVWDCAGVS